jgi:hypothetical protein
MSAENRDFDRILLDAIYEGLVKVFGKDTAKSVAFYIDPNLATADPSNYARSLEKLYREGAKVVLDTIVENLARKSGIAINNSESFGQLVLDMKLAFNGAGRR